MIKYMLDTDIAIYVINERPVSILDTFNENVRIPVKMNTDSGGM